MCEQESTQQDASESCGAAGWMVEEEQRGTTTYCAAGAGIEGDGQGLRVRWVYAARNSGVYAGNRESAGHRRAQLADESEQSTGAEQRAKSKDQCQCECASR